MHAAAPVTDERIDLALASETETAQLAARIAACLSAGDIVLLSGPVGAGKSTFARAAIRALLDDPAAEVPSPTFTLVQTYPSKRGEIWHADLYRLGDPGELVELGLDEAFGTAICFVEWPDRLGDAVPAETLDLHFAARAHGGHEVRISARPEWAVRLGSLR